MVFCLFWGLFCFGWCLVWCFVCFEGVVLPFFPLLLLPWCVCLSLGIHLLLIIFFFFLLLLHLPSPPSSSASLMSLFDVIFDVFRSSLSSTSSIYVFEVFYLFTSYLRCLQIFALSSRSRATALSSRSPPIRHHASPSPQLLRAEKPENPKPGGNNQPAQLAQDDLPCLSFPSSLLSFIKGVDCLPPYFHTPLSGVSLRNSYDMIFVMWSGDFYPLWGR